MRVGIVGAGALGSVYGAWLARSGCAVEVVSRSGGPPSRVSVEQVGGQAYVWDVPASAPALSAEADVALVAVRYEDLEDLPPRVALGKAPLVLLTPMLPDDCARLEGLLPGRVVPAMPSVVAYRKSAETIRFWLPGAAATLVERRAAGGAEIDLVRRLTHAGMSSRLEEGVLARNAATTVSFVALVMALAAAGSVEAVLEDRDLLALAFEATRESAELARALGKPEAWATMMLRFAGPLRLKAGVSLARARAPEVLRYIDEHFGRKLAPQTTLLAGRIVALAASRGTPHRALDRLLARLRATRPPGAER